MGLWSRPYGKSGVLSGVASFSAAYPAAWLAELRVLRAESPSLEREERGAAPCPCCFSVVRTLAYSAHPRQLDSGLRWARLCDAPAAAAGGSEEQLSAKAEINVRSCVCRLCKQHPRNRPPALFAFLVVSLSPFFFVSQVPSKSPNKQNMRTYVPNTT
jgi:hypothetical protein